MDADLIPPIPLIPPCRNRPDHCWHRWKYRIDTPNDRIDLAMRCCFCGRIKWVDYYVEEHGQYGPNARSNWPYFEPS